MESENSPEFRKAKIRSAIKPLHLLPHEVIEEILSKLPVKSLLKFRCVSKSWLSSINSRFFIKKSLQNSTEWRAISPNDDPNNYHLLTDSIVVGSCINGLICILKEKTFFLWNPSIRISFELPKIDLQMTKYGFGWDEDSDAYKVFAVVSEREENIGKVYSTKTNSWKTVEHGCLSLLISDGVFTCGKIHWPTKTGSSIESFDLKSEVFGLIEPPCERGVGMRLHESDGCLGVLCYRNRTRLDFWVMKKYGVKESWVIQNTASIPPKYKSNFSFTLNRDDKGMTFTPRETDNIYYINESLVSPVWNSRQDEIGQEQIHAVAVAEGYPRRSTAGYGDQGTKENPNIEKEQLRATCVNEGRPKPQNKRKEMEQEQAHASIAEGRPKRQNRRRPARYDT